MCHTNTCLCLNRFVYYLCPFNKCDCLYMSVPTIAMPTENLLRLGIKNTENIHYQLSPEELVQDTLRMGEGVLNDTGALVIRTGEFTGRSPKDKFTVKDETTADSVNWNDFNIPIEPKYFDIACRRIEEASRQPDLFIPQPVPIPSRQLTLQGD